MSSTFAQVGALLTNSLVIQQVAGALLGYVDTVLSEDPTTSQHVNRSAYAEAILAAPIAQAQAALPILLTAALLSAEAGNAAGASGTPLADADVSTTVTGLFTALANTYVTSLSTPSPQAMSPRTLIAYLMRDQTVKDQLLGSLTVYAQAIFSESGTATDHANRLAFAAAVVVNPSAWAQFIMPSILTNAFLAETSWATGIPISGSPFSDANMDSAVGAIYNSYADYYVAQQNSGTPINLG